MSDKKNHTPIRQWSFNDINVIDCEECQYAHLHPFPTKSELNKYYKDLYHREKWNFPYETIDNELVEKHKIAALNNEQFSEIFEVVNRYLDSASSPRCLDVGAGNNLLGFYFEAKGWCSSVLEPSIDACEYQKKFIDNVLMGDIETYSAEKLDVYEFINLQFVLEHVEKPPGVLGILRSLMHDDSILRIVVPNDFSPGQLAWLEMDNSSPSWISYPDHINYFHFDSLSNLIKKAGLEEIHRGTTFPLEWLLLTGQDYYLKENSKVNVNKIIQEFETSWVKSKQESHLRAIYETFASLGMGRSVVIYAKKSM